MFTHTRKQQIGDYVITFQIKEGDYAETYRVKDSTGKNRFLKLINCAKLHRTQFDENGNILEVKIAKNLNHDNVIKYHNDDNLIIDGQKYAYIVFDYISGETASQFLAREDECSVYDAKNIVIGVLEGLRFLHSLSEPVIHNEITPQNIMLDTSTGAILPKIIDFGYARYLSQDSNAFNKNGLSLLTAVNRYPRGGRLVPRWAVERYRLGRIGGTGVTPVDIEAPTSQTFSSLLRCRSF